MFQMNGIDKNGVTRVYGRGPTLDLAETECRRAVVEYCQRRREMKIDDFEYTVPYHD